MRLQVGLPTWLQLQEVSADGMSLVGSSRELIRNNETWEGPVIEAPFLVLREVGSLYVRLACELFWKAARRLGCTMCRVRTISVVDGPVSDATIAPGFWRDLTGR